MYTMMIYGTYECQKKILDSSKSENPPPLIKKILDQ